QDLSVRRLVALALRLRPEARDRLARRVDADLTGIEHLEAEDVEVLAGPGADDLGEARDTDAHQLAALALLRLLTLQLGIADAIHRLLERRTVVAAVVFPPERRPVRELLRLDEVLHPELGGVHAELTSHQVHHALDRVHRFGHPERAAIRDPAGRLVRV